MKALFIKVTVALAIILLFLGLRQGHSQYQVGLSAPMTATSGSIGGGALLAGACTSGTVSVPGATTAMVAHANPVTYPGDGAQWDARVTSTNTVTVRVCVILALTPVSSTYNVRVIQ